MLPSHFTDSRVVRAGDEWWLEGVLLRLLLLGMTIMGEEIADQGDAQGEEMKGSRR